MTVPELTVNPITSLIAGENMPPTLIESFSEHVSDSLITEPYTMTSYYEELLNHLLNKSTKNNQIEILAAEKLERLRVIGELAFDNMIKHKKLSSACLPCGSMSMDEYSYGLLERVEKLKPSKKDMFVFAIKPIQEYLAACHQCQLIRTTSDKMKTFKSKSVVAALRDSINTLPLTGNVWRMTFGLLAKDNLAFSDQQCILKTLVSECLNVITMSSFDITSLCVESIYESQMGARWFTGLSDASDYPGGMLDCFTLNQTISYSGVSLPQHRVPYTLCSLGYLLSICSDMFGLYLSDFAHLNATTTSCLGAVVVPETTSTIHVLNLSHNKLQAHGISDLQPLLCRLQFLTHLDLGYCYIEDQGLRVVSDLLEQMSLLFLRLSFNDITDLGFAHFAENLRYCRNLEWLDMSNNHLTDISVPKLADALPKLEKLRSLDLGENAMTDIGIQSLSAHIEGLRPLSAVPAKSNDLSSPAAGRRTNQRWTTKSVRKVSMHLNRIPAGGVMAKNKWIRTKSIVQDRTSDRSREAKRAASLERHVEES